MKPLNIREKRTLIALIAAPRMREDLDRIAGQSNSPELVAGLRRKGLEVPCYRMEVRDRDNKVCRPGRYELTAGDRAIVREWLGGRNAR